MGANTEYKISDTVFKDFASLAVSHQDSVNLITESKFIDFDAQHGLNDELELLLRSMRIPYIRSWSSAIDIEPGVEITLMTDAGNETITHQGDELVVPVKEVVDAYNGKNNNFFDNLVTQIEKFENAVKEVESFTIQPEQALANLIQNDAELKIDEVENVYLAFIDELDLDWNKPIIAFNKQTSLGELLKLDEYINERTALVEHFNNNGKDVDTTYLADTLDVELDTTSAPH